MSTTFPTTKDALTNPTSTDTLASPSHSGQHSDVNDAIEALETKIGIDNSLDTNSLDYKIRVQVSPTITSPVINTGVSGTAILDEDTMSSDSATKLATQQSIKAYVDSTKYIWKGDWTTLIAYSVNDIIVYGSSGYICEIAHTSGTFSTDLAAGKWGLFVEGYSGVNDIMFRVWRNAAANSGNGTAAVVAFDTENYDVGSNVVNGVFTAPINGYYTFSWACVFAADGNAKDCLSALYIDDTLASRGGRNILSTVNPFGSTGSDTVYMAANSTADIRAYAAATTALAVGNTGYNYFSGRLVSL